MKISLFVFVCIVGILACDKVKQGDKAEEKIPKALQEEKSASYLELRKSGSGNMVNNLYDELVTNTPSLQQLEKKIAVLNDNKLDSTNSFKKFENNSNYYYNSAKTNVLQVKDSLLRDTILSIINQSMAKYHTLVSGQYNLVAGIESKDATLRDLHSVLKIIKTLSVIEKYQTENHPSRGPLEAYSKQLDSAINYVESLIKKPE